MRYFEKVDPDTLPEDLAKDAVVFRALAMRQQSAVDPRLLAEIDAAVEAEKVQSQVVVKPRRPWFAIWGAVGAAACIAVVVVIGLLYPQTIKDTTGSTHSLLANNQTHNIDEVQKNDDTVRAKEETDTPTGITLPNNIEKTSPSSVQKAKPVVETVQDDGIVYIDDPTEGAAILAQVDSKIRNIAQTTQASLKRADIIIPQIPEDVLNNIPQLDEIIQKAVDNINGVTI